jgi:hypothetical protein
MGYVSNQFNVQSPTSLRTGIMHWQIFACCGNGSSPPNARASHLVAAVQVAFENPNFVKPAFHFIGSRVGKPGAFELWVNWIRELVQPHLVSGSSPTISFSTHFFTSV